MVAIIAVLMAILSITPVTAEEVKDLYYPYYIVYAEVDPEEPSNFIVNVSYPAVPEAYIGVELRKSTYV